MNNINETQYNAIINAGQTLCEYCEADECENCIITRLITDATNEAIKSGIIEEN